MGRPLKWQANPVMQNIIAKNRSTDRKDELHWLDLQKSGRYAWRKNMRRMPAGQRTYYRRLGVVESLFDGDGLYWCGRADLHQNLRLEIRTSMTEDELRDRLVLSWALMRHSHVLLASKAVYLHELGESPYSENWTSRCFAYDWPRTSEQAINEARAHVIFVGDEYPDLDTSKFFAHAMNTARALDPDKGLSRLYVLPFKKTDRGTTLVHLIPILAHQITDGLTTYRWTRHWIEILNADGKQLQEELSNLFTDEVAMNERLPPAQEELYPLRSYSRARECWHWLITRILRHVRQPPPPAFQNPLRRDQVLQDAETYPQDYSRVLDYGQKPPLNAARIDADLYGRSYTNMRLLCKAAGVSIGSGSFTYVAMVMMALEEKRNPDVPLNKRLPFCGSFPVNPRPFFAGTPTTGKENSCMLAFSDGVTLPFLPSHLDFVRRFKLLSRLAQTQLRQYQKRQRSLAEELHLGSRSPSQLIPALYCSTLERMEDRSTGPRRAGLSVQGKYPAAKGASLATCGISSVGDISAILPPRADLSASGEGEIATEQRGFASTVRPRDGEFLVGAVGTKEYFGFGVAYDANAMDQKRVHEWKQMMESMLDQDLDIAQPARL